MPRRSLAPALAQVLAAELPITQSLGIGVARVDASGVELTLPLAANRNHKGTVFAGSLNAAATLAGWSVLWVELQERGLDAHVVIQDATIRYVEPARSDVRASCARPAAAILEHALQVLERRGRCRVSLHPEVHDGGGGLVATLSGRYVIHRRNPSPDQPRPG